jgi:hypothetical protein
VKSGGESCCRRCAKDGRSREEGEKRPQLQHAGGGRFRANDKNLRKKFIIASGYFDTDYHLIK